jgi:hypothetical protein
VRIVRPVEVTRTLRATTKRVSYCHWSFELEPDTNHSWAAFLQFGQGRPPPQANRLMPLRLSLMFAKKLRRVRFHSLAIEFCREQRPVISDPTAPLGEHNAITN